MLHSKHSDPGAEPGGSLDSAPVSDRDRRRPDPRMRLLEAMVSTVSYRGYDRTTLERVLQTADVPAAVFDEHFANKEDCFLKALDDRIEHVERRVLEQFESPRAWPDRVRLGLCALLSALAEDPEGARVLLVECLSAGPTASARHRSVLAVFVPVLEEGRAQAAYPEYLPPQTSEAVVGGIVSILHRRVLEGRAVELPSLLSDMVYFTLVPYLGHHRAILAGLTRED